MTLIAAVRGDAMPETVDAIVNVADETLLPA